ncbi:MAG: efflux RND transporter periplasmic adaptor subunit [Spirochaetes bacterium]|nr:efflux RND transporter periplasmic adaptor subunit [Spirochaetota bacterium]
MIRARPPAIRAAMLAALTACSFAACRKAVPEADAAARTVRAQPAGIIEAADELSSFGTVSFFRKAELSSPADGIIASLPFREGDFVRKGAVAATIRNVQYELSRARAEDGITQADAALELAAARLFEGELAVEARLVGVEKAEIELDQLKVELSDAERKLRDKEKLFEAGGVPEEDLRTARLGLESQRVGLRLMEKDLEAKRIGFRDADLAAAGLKPGKDQATRRRAFVELNTATLRAERDAAKAGLAAAGKELESADIALRELAVAAPVAGVLGGRFVEEGERVKAGDKLVVVMDTSKVHAVVPVREDEAGRLKPGMDAKLRVDAVGDRSFAGTVDAISPAADPGVGAFTVKVLVANSSGELKPGMFARVTIQVGATASYPAVPTSALLGRSGARARIQVVSGGRIAWRDVETGKESDGLAAIRSGIARGELVVVRPDPSMEEGERVELEE